MNKLQASHTAQVKAEYRVRIEADMAAGWTAERSVKVIRDRDGARGMWNTTRRTALRAVAAEYGVAAATVRP
jgi:hypothetical protein